ncbi:uncharacterized protein At1g28695-like [Cornus florida]|uniref:uncharacterized protein At1g28695-like n=1 Tax=Cornus florida TaxID=4283 RepID=UPI002896A231|nr:uncharacterized protein At1g28695-like [Cornus florida]
MATYIKNNFSNIAGLSFLFVGVVYLIFWSPIITFKPFFSTQNHPYPQSNSLQQDVQNLDELEVALEKASMFNKTLVIAMVNKAYVEQHNDDVYMTMLDLFLESFWVGEETRPLIDHLLLVAVDQTAYDRCKFRGLHCYKLVTDGVDYAGEKLFMSDEFINMMWRRTLFLLDVLKRGYNFIFTDTDVMWLRNPFGRLSKNESEDIQISTDDFNGDPWSEYNYINTGFYYVRSNNRTISLFQTWYDMKDNSTGIKEQDVLVSLIYKGVFRQLGLKVRFLDSLYFSGFCKDSRDITAVTTVHANCCRSIRAKVADLAAVLRDWKKFRRLITASDQAMAAGNRTQTFQWSKHIGCHNSWRVDPNNSTTLG